MFKNSANISHEYRTNWGDEPTREKNAPQRTGGESEVETSRRLGVALLNINFLTPVN